jgi:DNA invertase Pin-like site-specific DNA recombinase
MLHDRPSLAVAADPGWAATTLSLDAAAAGKPLQPEARIPHLDRLARSLKQLIETVEEFGTRKVGLRSLTEAIDTTTAGGKLVFHIFAALAEFERGVIRERTMAGLQAARARGRTGGRPPALEAKDLAAAKAMLKDPEITVLEVARRLGVAASTLYRHLPRARTAALEA